jgi:hypothetical protein
MSASTGIDVSLLSFLNSADAREEEQQLSRLISEYAEPTVKRVIKYRLKADAHRGGVRYNNPDVEELYHDIQLRLLKRLWDLKRDPSKSVISNLESYITSTANHVCDEYLRRKFPSRRHLKDRVRYHLINHPEFRLCENGERVWLAGLAAWGQERFDGLKEVDAKPDVSLLKSLSDELQSVDAYSMQLRPLLKIVFRICGRPLEFDSLTGLIAQLQGVKEKSAVPLSAGSNSLTERLISPQEEIDVVLQYRQLLQYLWDEICKLPRRQRIALLFNLKGPNGINVITLIPATRVATFEEIATALELHTEQLEAIWPNLPMDDLSIAEYLGATRQQVINLRKNARERLSRRMDALGNMRL